MLPKDIEQDVKAYYRAEEDIGANIVFTSGFIAVSLMIFAACTFKFIAVKFVINATHGIWLPFFFVYFGVLTVATFKVGLWYLQKHKHETWSFNLLVSIWCGVAAVTHLVIYKATHDDLSIIFAAHLIVLSLSSFTWSRFKVNNAKMESAKSAFTAKESILDIGLKERVIKIVAASLVCNNYEEVSYYKDGEVRKYNVVTKVDSEALLAYREGRASVEQCMSIYYAVTDDGLGNKAYDDEMLDFSMSKMNKHWEGMMATS